MESPQDSLLTRLSVETPEQVQLQLEVAGLGTRSMAFLIDYGVVFVTLLTLVLAVQFATQQSLLDWPWGTNQIVLPLVIVTVFLLFWGYFLIFEWVWNGQTPGKRAVHIRVVKDGGYPISFLDSVVRNLLRAADCYFPPFFFAIGVICIFAHPRHKRIGDLVARTVVVLERPLHFEPLQPPVAVRPTVLAPAIESLDLSVEELELVDSYWTRRRELDPASAAKLRAEIVDYLLAKVNSNGRAVVIPTETQETFLEEVLAHRAPAKRP